LYALELLSLCFIDDLNDDDRSVVEREGDDRD
jgi:hypothetical protein